MKTNEMNKKHHPIPIITTLKSWLLVDGVYAIINPAMQSSICVSTNMLNISP